MGFGVRVLGDARAELVVDRAIELKPFTDWMDDVDAPSVLWSVRGIGGIGKTTFLGEIRDRANRQGLSTVFIDGYVGFSSASELLLDICTGLGMENANGKEIPQMLNLISRWCATYRTILLFDHFEEMTSLDSFTRTELVPLLPENGVMLIFASRCGLSMGWRTDPTLITRTKQMTLRHFTWTQSVDYMKRLGIHDEHLRQRISRETSGYPLALALAAQSALQWAGEEERDSLPTHEISARLIREVAPHLNPLVEGLVFLKSCTQDVLSDVLQDDISFDDFTALRRLSFVRETEMGLAVHDVVRAYMLHDLKTRNPHRFDVLFQRTVHVLGRMLESAVNSRQTYDLSHNLVTLCSFATSVLAFPNASIPMDVSNRALPKCEPAMESDIDTLLSLLDTGVVAGPVMPFRESNQALLKLMACKFPESLRVIHHEDGRPAAFATLLPLYEESVASLPRVLVQILRESLGAELKRYEHIALAETDTVLSLISCVPQEAREYTFSDLLLGLKVDGWTELAGGKRCLLLNTVPDVNAFYSQLQYDHLHRKYVEGLAVDVYALDFRTASIGTWLVPLLLKSQTRRKCAIGDVSKDMLRDALRQLYQTDALAQCAFTKAMNVPVEEVQNMLLQALSDVPPPKPLSTMLQSILSAWCSPHKTSVIATAQSLNIGRTTYYRYLDKALSALLKVIERQLH